MFAYPIGPTRDVSFQIPLRCIPLANIYRRSVSFLGARIGRDHGSPQ